MKYTWTIEVTIDPTWIADGFDFESDDDATEKLRALIPMSYSGEVTAKILTSPDRQAIRKEQGY